MHIQTGNCCCGRSTFTPAPRPSAGCPAVGPSPRQPCFQRPLQWHRARRTQRGHPWGHLEFKNFVFGFVFCKGSAMGQWGMCWGLETWMLGGPSPCRCPPPKWRPLGRVAGRAEAAMRLSPQGLALKTKAGQGRQRDAQEGKKAFCLSLEQRALHFHFALGPENHEAGPG